MERRRHDLDALRAFAMLLGIVLHAALSFFQPTWPVQDERRSHLLELAATAIHGFRMPLFFLISGYFAMMLCRRRGLAALLRNRANRILLPCLLGLLTIVPLTRFVWTSARHAAPPPIPAPVAPAAARAAPTLAAADTYRAFLFSDRFRVEIGGRSIHLLRTPVFDHLWFLSVLLWLIAGLAVTILAARRFRWAWPPRLPILPVTRFLWLVPLTLGPQALMSNAPVAFGGEAAPGLLPLPHVLLYYAVFFAFGALYFDADDARNELGRRWPVLLACGLLVAFPLGLAAADRPLLAALSHALYAWCMVFGLIGLFRAALRRESRAVRYISDASYWMYLAHPPLLIALQLGVRAWPLPAPLKLALLSLASALILLACYHAFVRYTWLGALLNGPRNR